MSNETKVPIMPDGRDLPNMSGVVQRHRAPLRRRLLHVVRTMDLSPTFRRIIFSGDDLEQDFPFAHFAPGDHVKIFFPDPNTGEVAFPEPDASPKDRPALTVRDYTVRAFNPYARELAIEFVLHPHGPAGRWAAAAVPGDTVGIAGPRGHKLLPQNYDHYLIAGDESALPALARFLEEAPASAQVTAAISVADASAQIPLTTRQNHRVMWVDRSGEPDNPLETALRQLDLPRNLFVFAAGEATALKPIRRYLRFERGIPKEQIKVDGYWKQGVIALDHHANEVGDD